MLKLLKRFVAASIVISTALCGVTVHAIKPKDFNDHMMLKNLGILDENADIDQPATRSDLAKVGLGLMNALQDFEDIAAESIYDDVKSDDQYANIVYGAYIKGLMVGTGSGSFSPDGYLTKEMITSVMGRVCGYGGLERNLWENFGLNDLELYKQVRFSEPITLGELCDVAENCLTAQMITVKPQYNSRGEAEKAYVRSDETVLEFYFEIYEGEGIVHRNSISGINTSSGSRRGTVIINDEEYDVGKTNAYELRGIYCNYYYRDGEDVKELICIQMDSQVDMITLDSRDVIRYEDRYYVYNNNGAAKKLRAPISKSADILYNGKPLANPTDSDFKPVNWLGEVTLIDNYGAGEYDVVFIYSYRNIIVTDINKDENILYDTINNQREMLGQEEGVDFDVYINGEKSSFADIGTDYVASVFEAADGYKLVYACKDNFLAKINLVSSEDGEIRADGVDYKVSNSSIINAVQTKIGYEVELYLDSSGRIACVNTVLATGENEYAIITSLKPDDDEDVLIVKLFSDDGLMKKLYLKERFKLNGKTVKIKNGGTGWSSLWDENVLDNRKLIKYVLSDEETIKEIDIPVDATYNDIYNASPYKELRRVFHGNASNLLYYKTAGEHFVDMNGTLAWPTTYETDKSTVVFIMPDSSSDTDGYAVSKINEFSNNQRIIADMYRATESKKVDVMVMKGEESRSTDASNMIVVGRIKNELNADDEVVTVIEGYMNGAANTRIALKANDTYAQIDGTSMTLEQYVKTLNFGDFLLFQKNTNGEITQLKKMYDAQAEVGTIPSSLTVDSEMGLYGKITNYKDGIITITNTSKNVDVSYKYSGPIVVCDPENKEVRLGTEEDLRYDRKICLYIQESRARLAVVYK